MSNYGLLEALESLVQEIKSLDSFGCDHSVGICNCETRQRIHYAENAIREARLEPTLCYSCGKREDLPNNQCPESGLNHPGAS